MTEQRPWGRFTVISDNPTYKVKEIVVRAGHKLSYQSHRQRQEYWTIITGKARVTIDGEWKTYGAGQSIHIPFSAKHRIENIGYEDLVFVEVQTGEYFGEDDIIRYEDDYGRKDPYAIL